MDYNKTINLPKTDFPMRAGLPKREPEMLKRWQEQDVYNEMLKKNEGKPLFNLHDGPPFSNGALDSCETRRRVKRGGLSENVSFLESVRISKRGRVTGVIPSACDSRQ